MCSSDLWQPTFENPRYNPGSSPASEAETKAIVSLVSDLKPRLIIHAHAWEPCIVFSGEPGRKDAERLARSSGYELKEHIGYPTPGALSQFAWADHRIPVICIEEKSGVAKSEIWPRFENGIREIFGDGSIRT